jgi:membrane-associated phospholipid phosphatase
VIRYLGAAIVFAALYALLGVSVSHAPPSALDRAGHALLGGPPHLALLFTESCFWNVLVALGLVGIVVAVRVPTWRERIVTSLVTTVVMWQASDVLKNLFRRPRPDYWRIIHEPTFAYSSGHAMFATIVYGLWAWFIWRSDLPSAVRFTVTPLLALWACGILWSRLALGAHWVTDLIGGVLLGLVGLSAGATIRAALHARRAAA